MEVALEIHKIMTSVKKPLEDALKEYEGKKVGVITHLLSHLSSPREMLCIGPVSQGSLYLFMDSAKEELNGERIINGMLGHRGHVGYEGEGIFLIYNDHQQYPFREIKGLRQEDYQRAIKLWEARER